ncbi:hypothetical protein [Nocardia alni]|uniref:hypothetical protein n=1 Tax=Nocardia alni TaxID=2815723 RepID=UPI001C2189B4|nr:hypothetical protein [Nocardia alni]
MARSAPQPPFSTDLLADLHADNVAPDLSEQLWPQVRRDPEALRFLRSLDDVTAELRTLGQDSAVLHPMPAQVTERLDRLLDQLACGDPPLDGESGWVNAEHVATVHHLPFAQSVDDRPTTQPIPTLPMPAVGAELATDSPAAPVVRLDRRRWRWLAAAAAAIAVVAGSLVAVDTFRDHPAAPDASTTTQSDDVQLSTDLPVSQLLGAMGRRDLSGPLADPGALAGCLAGAGLDRTILGAMNATYRSRPAVLVLLTGPNPPKITAVVLGKDCRPSAPHILVTQDIG